MQLALTTLAGSFIIITSLLFITNSFHHLLAFTQPIQQPPPSSSSSSPQPTILQRPVGGTTENGTIDSLIFTPATRWIATGNWSIGINNGIPTFFITNMTWYNNNGTGTHTHELQNFRSTQAGQITIEPNNSLFLRGVMDVGTNHRIVWKNVQSTIDIKGGKTISILLNDNQTNRHFAGQPIYGIVTSFTRCSDEPGPNMEVLPPCKSPLPQQSTTFSTTTNTGQQSPALLTNSSSTGSGTTSAGLTTSNTTTQTGKSPFDILGGG
jgi:hypothetical protein